MKLSPLDEDDRDQILNDAFLDANPHCQHPESCRISRHSYCQPFQTLEESARKHAEDMWGKHFDKVDDESVNSGGENSMSDFIAGVKSDAAMRYWKGQFKNSL